MQRSLTLFGAVSLFAFASSGLSLQNDNEAARSKCIAQLSGFPATDAALDRTVPTDTKGFTLKYFASGCLGKCASFTLTLGEGLAQVEGHDYVRAKGKRTTKVSQQQFEAFLHGWYDGKLYAMRDDYCTPTCPDGRVIIATDIPESSITLATPGFTKQVFVCYWKGHTPQPPEQYFELERQVLAFARAHRWL